MFFLGVQTHPKTRYLGSLYCYFLVRVSFDGVFRPRRGHEAHGLGCHRHSQDASSIDMGVDFSCSDLGEGWEGKQPDAQWVWIYVTLTSAPVIPCEARCLRIP